MRRNGIKKIVVLALLIMICVSSMSVYAATGWDPSWKTISDIKWTDQADIDASAIQGYFSIVKSNDKQKIISLANRMTIDPATYTGTTMTIALDKTYTVNAEYMQQEFYNTMFRQAKLQQQVSTISEGFDVTADTAGATRALSGGRGLVAKIVGFITVAIVVGVPLFTSLDILYITTPMIRGFCDVQVESGNKYTTRKDSKTGETKLRWITDDAVYAVTNATIESGKHPLMVYGGRRIGSIILLTVVLYILLTGNITLITNIAINMVSGLLDVLGEMGA